MFDRTDQASLDALWNERTLDPIGMGYSANDTQFVNEINDPASNVGNETTFRTLTTGTLLGHIIPADFDAQQVSDGERRYIESFLGREFGSVIEDYRSKIRSAFKLNSTTVANIDSDLRRLSRAEVLFGEDTILTKYDWWAARDSR